jgi:hypothetical protein
MMEQPEQTGRRAATLTNVASLSAAELGRPLRLLLIDTTRWAIGARLAATFLGLGCEVSTLRLAKGYPADSLPRIAARFRYRGLSPVASIRDAMLAFEPDLVIPICDRSASYLHTLHGRARAAGTARIVECIERSIGPAESYRIVASRYELLRIASEEGVRIPAMMPIRGEADLQAFARTQPLPWVIKADGSWGGQGVRMATSLEAAKHAWCSLGRRDKFMALLARLATNRDCALQLADWMQPHPEIMAQSWIDGTPANCAVVCWEGEVLAGIAVEVKATLSPIGPSRMVEVVDGAEMLLAARRIAARLRMSGFFGLDFMIDRETREPFLIEMNPRTTPCCVLQLGKGRNLAPALFARVTETPEPDTPPRTTRSKIAYFPQPGWSADGPAPGEAPEWYYDVPVDAPELMPILMHPRRKRSLLGVLVDRIAVSRRRAALAQSGPVEREEEAT